MTKDRQKADLNDLGGWWSVSFGCLWIQSLCYFFLKVYGLFSMSFVWCRFIVDQDALALTIGFSSVCNIRPSSSCFNGHGAQSFQKGHAVVNLAEQSRLETKRCSFRREAPRRNFLSIENSWFFLLYYNFVHLLYHQTYIHISYYDNIIYTHNLLAI